MVLVLKYIFYVLVLASEVLVLVLGCDVLVPIKFFYRAMHFSAERGLATACRLSVCPSVTLVICDHIGWKSWKLTAQTTSPTPLLFAAKRRFTYSQGNRGSASEVISAPLKSSDMLALYK